MNFDNIESEGKINEGVSGRQHRSVISGFNPKGKMGLKFRSGDVLRLSFNKGPIIYSFEGVCLAVRSSSLQSKHTSIVLRNVLQRVGVEFIVSYYLNRIYNMEFNDYKRKHFSYKKNRLFYLRERINRESRVL